jgi:hypothetical protein
MVTELPECLFYIVGIPLFRRDMDSVQIGISPLDGGYHLTNDLCPQIRYMTTLREVAAVLLRPEVHLALFSGSLRYVRT